MVIASPDLSGRGKIPLRLLHGACPDNRKILLISFRMTEEGFAMTKSLSDSELVRLRSKSCTPSFVISYNVPSISEVVC